MRVLRSLDELPRPLPFLVLTIGNFDGVHRGHRRILARVVKAARSRRGTAAALTFHPHPAKILGRPAPPLLTTLEQKLTLLEAAGLDLVLVLPFTRALSRLSPRQFVARIISRRLGARRLHVGPNFRFGHRAAGDVRVLRRLARQLGFALEVVPRVRVSEQTASSTLIRRLLAAGRVRAAARLLGQPYALTGDIRPGQGRGAPLGFPTLNLAPEQECLPARGVYVTQTLVAGKAFPSATNVGVRPTFAPKAPARGWPASGGHPPRAHGGQGLVVESHLLGFARTLRRGRLEGRFHERLRAEKKFSSATALRAQIRRDVERARRFFARRPPARV